MRAALIPRRRGLLAVDRPDAAFAAPNGRPSSMRQSIHAGERQRNDFAPV
jgi:hypothetical protein